jgi:hypothetical protein
VGFEQGLFDVPPQALIYRCYFMILPPDPIQIGMNQHMNGHCANGMYQIRRRWSENLFRGMEANVMCNQRA